jgi:hypothetical protein
MVFLYVITDGPAMPVVIDPDGLQPDANFHGDRPL